MAGTAPMFTQAQRDNVEVGLQNEAITDHPLLVAMERNGRIKFNEDVNNPTKSIRPFYSSHELRTWGRMTPVSASEKELVIQATYTDGQYFDEEAVSSLDRRKFKNNRNMVYNVVEEAMAALLGRVKDRFHEELRAGDGSAKVTGEGTSIVGLNNVLTTSNTTGTYAGINRSGNTFWQHASVNGGSGPNSDWDLDQYNRVSTTISNATLRQDGQNWRPDIGFMDRDHMLDLREVWFDKGQQISNNSRINAHLGANPDMITIDGVDFFIDQDVRTDTIEVLNSQSMELHVADDKIFKLEEKPSYGHVGTPTVLEVTFVGAFIVMRPRLNGILHSAVIS